MSRRQERERENMLRERERESMFRVCQREKADMERE